MNAAHLRPRSAEEMASLLQKRLSTFGLAVNSVRRDLSTMQRIAEELRGGFSISDEDRRELADISLRLFDAGEVL